MNIQLTLATALLVAATPAFAQVSTESGSKVKGAGKLSVVSSESIDGDDDKVNSIQLKVENGKITVKRNGKDIPASRIRTEDNGQVTILDENGDPIDNVRLFTGVGEDGAWVGGDQDNIIRFFDGQGVQGFKMHDGGEGGFWSTAVGDDEAAPKVMIGVHMTEPGAALEKHLRLKHGKTAIITGVFEGLPAEVAGIGEHDIIIAIDDSDQADAGTIRKILTSKEPGDTCVIQIIQAGEPKEVRLKLQAYDAKKLGSAKLLGKEPMDQMWTYSTDPLSDLSIDLKGLQHLPQIKDRVFVAPQDLTDWQGLTHLRGLEMEKLQPQIQEAMQNALKTYKGAIRFNADGEAVDLHNESVTKDVEAQLDRLDKRMAQLESLIEKLVQQKAKP